MKYFSQRALINVSLLIGLLFLIGSSIVSYLEIQDLARSNRWVLHTRDVIAANNKTLISVLDAESRTRYNLLFPGTESISNIVFAIHKNLGISKTLTTDNPSQQLRIKKLEIELDQWIDLLNKINFSDAHNKIAEGIKMSTSVEFLTINKNIKQYLTDINNEELKLLNIRLMNSSYHLKLSNILYIFSIGLSGLLFFTSLILLNYHLYQGNILRRKQLLMAKELQISEERFKLTTEGSNVGIWDWDPKTNIVYYSPNFKKMLGYTEEEFPDKLEMFNRILHPDDYKRVWDAVNQHLNNRVPFAIEYRLMTKSGDYRWIQASGLALWNKQGIPTRMSGTFIDISERKESEAKFTAQYELTQDLANANTAILESATDSIITKNKKGQILSVNSQTLKEFNYEKDELIDTDIKTIIPDWTFIHPEESKGSTYEFTGLRKNGESFPIEIKFSRLIYHKQDAVVINVRNISDRKKIENIKNEFVSVVSHELRTPLTSIRGSLGLILGGSAGNFSEKAKTLLDIANNNCQRLLLLINDILDLEKIEAGKMDFKRDVINVKNLIMNSIIDNMLYSEKFHVKLEAEEIDPDITIKSDFDRLMQVMTNLISNAVKFSPSGETVKIKTDLINNSIRISVSNKGHGIPIDFQSKIFKKFSQADSTSTRAKGGTGLGLSICKTIVDSLGGKLNFVSLPNELTTFYVEMPIWKDEAEIAKNKKDLVDMIEGGKNTIASNYKERLLICEDDMEQAKFISELLQTAGFDVDISKDAEGARKMLYKRHYHALLLDLILPDQDGITFIRELRKDSHTKDLPIIVLSMIAHSGKNLLNGHAISVIDWLDKPIDFSKLLKAIKKIKTKMHPDEINILHVEDDYDTHVIIKNLFEPYANIFLARSLKETIKKVKSIKFDLVILDLLLADGSGADLLPLFDEFKLPVIIYSAYDLDQKYSEIVKAALVKSKTSNEKLLLTIKKALDTMI